MFDAWQLTFILNSAILYSGHDNNKQESEHEVNRTTET